MPGINDSPDQVEELLGLCEEAGATHISGIALHLRGEVKDIFFAWLRAKRPDLLPRYEDLYARGAYADPAERKRLGKADPAKRPQPHRAWAGPTPADPTAAAAGTAETRTRTGADQPLLKRFSDLASLTGDVPNDVPRDARERGAAGEADASGASELLVVAVFVAAIVIANHYREQLFGVDEPIRIIAAIALVVLGWAFARDFARALAEPMMRRLEPATAATVGFLVRLTFLGVAILVALRIGGLAPQEVAIGGAITVVILGLAAQQTLGNVIAGIVLISARPFKAGERIRLQGSGLAGETEGVVESLGLLYTTMRQGIDTVMVPNSVVLASAVVPLREPKSVDLRARLRPGVKPSQLQDILDSVVLTEMLEDPSISLEEIHADEVVVRISATPASDDDGPRLADEILAAIAPVTRVVDTEDLPDDGTGNGARSSEPTEALPASRPSRPGAD